MGQVLGNGDSRLHEFLRPPSATAPSFTVSSPQMPPVPSRGGLFQEKFLKEKKLPVRVLCWSQGPRKLPFAREADFQLATLERNWKLELWAGPLDPSFRLRSPQLCAFPPSWR